MFEGAELLRRDRMLEKLVLREEVCVCRSTTPYYDKVSDKEKCYPYESAMLRGGVTKQPL